MFQSFEDVLLQEKQLYYWQGSSSESYLKNTFVPGTAGHELYHKGIGLKSSEEVFAALEDDKGSLHE